MSNYLIAEAWIILGAIFIGRTLFFVVISLAHYLRPMGQIPETLNKNHIVSIVVPCYNEADTITNCIESLMGLNYDNYEIIIVNDGSTDFTKEIAEGLVHRFPRRVSLFNKENGGKASALNHGILYSQGSIIVTIDADSVFTRDALHYIAQSFEDPKVGAICGNVKVANRDTFLSAHQTVEYITGLNLQRRTFASLSCVQVISGAIGAFRKEALLSVGGYSSDTLVEDMDITIAFAQNGYRVEYIDKAIAYTEAPESLSDFIKQRSRWIFGSFQILSKYRRMFFNPSYGTMGMIGLPYFLMAPMIGIIFAILFIFTFISFAIYNPLYLINILGIACSLQALVALYALVIDRENLKLLVYSLSYTLWYQPILIFITARALVAFLMKSEIGWNKLERLGKNILFNSELVEI